jgi:hypothetical protein
MKGKKIMMLNETECLKAGLDIKKVKSIAKRLEKIALEAKVLHVEIFGGSSGQLRFHDDFDKGSLILAYVKGLFEGGCGATHDWGDGYERGE